MIVFGHRGAAGEAPENTLAGFRWAYEKAEVRNFELDVHLTRDGDLAVIHDDTLDRTTNGRGRIAERTMDELRSFDARAFFPNFKAASIPSLKEVLDIYAGAIDHFQLEIKTDAPERLEIVCMKLADAIKTYGLEGKAVVTSFDAKALELMRAVYPAVPRGLISYHYTDAVLETAKRLGCSNACIPLKAGNREAAAKAREAGLSVTGWLGNTKEDADTLLSWGVSEVTTNFPSLIVPYLRGR